MDCPICRDLKRTYEAGFREYIEARSSACFRACTRLAARKNVEMERARDEVEEHRLVGMRLRRQGVCTFAGAGRVYEFETTGCRGSGGIVSRMTAKPALESQLT